MIRIIIERTIRRLKRDPDYHLSSTYSARQLCTIVYWRALQVVRGLRLRAFIRSSESPLFCGRRVRIEHAYQLRVGGSLILDDDVYINALSTEGVVLGRNVTIARGCVVTCTGVIARCGTGVVIGDRSAIGAHSYLSGQGGITIGADVLMGPGVRIFSENHNFNDPVTAIRLQGETRARVTIEDDCWIGAGVTILAGVVVGRGSVVASGAVLTRSQPPMSVVAGIPGRVIGRRDGTAPPAG